MSVSLTPLGAKIAKARSQRPNALGISALVAQRKAYVPRGVAGRVIDSANCNLNCAFVIDSLRAHAHPLGLVWLYEKFTRERFGRWSLPTPHRVDAYREIVQGDLQTLRAFPACIRILRELELIAVRRCAAALDGADSQAFPF